MEKLITDTNAAGRKLPTPPLESWGKPLDSLGARSPVNGVAIGNGSIMMSFPVAVDPGLEEGLIAVLHIQRRLFQT